MHLSDLLWFVQRYSCKSSSFVQSLFPCGFLLSSLSHSFLFSVSLCGFFFSTLSRSFLFSLLSCGLLCSCRFKCCLSFISLACVVGLSVNLLSHIPHNGLKDEISPSCSHLVLSDLLLVKSADRGQASIGIFIEVQVVRWVLRSLDLPVSNLLRSHPGLLLLTHLWQLLWCRLDLEVECYIVAFAEFHF